MSRQPESRTRPCNVLVIGSGAAGLRAAITARQAGVDVLVIGKRSRLDAHTVLAAGGINAALGTVDPEDSYGARMTIESAPVPAVSEALSPWLAPAADLDSAGRLLE